MTGKRGRGNRHTFTPIQYRRITQRLQSGDRVAAIARDMRIDPGTLRRHLRELGVEPTAMGFGLSKD